MSDLAICSRAQAERLLSAGMVRVDGAAVSSNQKVADTSQIEIIRRRDTATAKIPISEDTKVWVFYKPRNLTTTLIDPFSRPTIYQFLDAAKFPRISVFTIGQMDYHSEGLVLLTNNEDLSKAAEFSYSHLTRKYEIRVNSRGRVNHRFVEEVKKGLQSRLKRFKPMHIWTRFLSAKSKNIWINAILEKSHPRELRSVFELKKIHVNRLICTKYGPYALEGLKPGEFSETSVHISFHKLLFNYYKKQAEKQ
jgi:23S rRNA pseudouridine2605 synthase